MGEDTAAASTANNTEIDPMLPDSCQANHAAANCDTASKPPPRTRVRRNRGRDARNVTSSTPCKFFAAGKCKYGEKCRYAHDVTNSETQPTISETTEELSTAPNNTELQQPDAQPVMPPTSSVAVAPRSVVRPEKTTCSLADKGTPAHRKIITSEIHYFRRRYPTSKRTETDDGGTEFTFSYEITNPEWVFDVKSIDFTIHITKDHPFIAPTLRVVRTSVLPDVLCNHMDSAFNKKILERISQFATNDSYEIMGKWLVRMIDRNIFELFVDGLKKTKMVKEAEACGIKCITLPSVKHDSYDEEDREMMPKLKELKKGVPKSDDPDPGKENQDSIESSSAEKREEHERDHQDSASAIEVRIHWNDYTGNIGTLTAKTMTFAVSCLKCPSADYFTCREGQRKAARCRRCGTGQSVLLKAEMVHQNSCLIGLLHLKGCKPVDCVLLQCQFRASCLNCSREFDVVNLSNGVVNKSWCHECHTKCEFSIFSTIFTGNFSLIAKEDKLVPRRTQKKKVDLGPVIVVGHPLPDRGTCQHYKKSFRWFRFPCCGKTFACDVCHEDAKMGHEMSYATRIICGMCSFEQPFMKDKPCSNCKESTVKSKSAHWEGGNGCRNRLVMSRNDEKKHKNSASKTTPRKRTGPKQSEKPCKNSAFHC